MRAALARGILETLYQQCLNCMEPALGGVDSQGLPTGAPSRLWHLGGSPPPSQPLLLKVEVRGVGSGEGCGVESYGRLVSAPSSAGG